MFQTEHFTKRRCLHIVTVRRLLLYAGAFYSGRTDFGKRVRLCELREKEVINICNCRRLGCVVDVDIDVCDGKVLAIIIPVPGKICGILGSDGEYVIPFGCIKKIGPDIILVEICEEKFLQKY